MRTEKSNQRVNFLKTIVAEEYLNNENISLCELSEKYHCCKGVLSRILKELNIPLRNRYHDINLKYNFDKINSEESAYWLGFIYADGSITYSPESDGIRYVLEIGLAIRDKEHLEKFKKFMGSDREITNRIKTNSCRFSISSKELCINLYNLGIRKGKTYILNIDEVLISIPKEYIKDFIRGYTDGDGSIFKDGTVSYTSYFRETMEILLLKLPFKIEYKIYIRDNRCPRICITRKQYYLKVLDFIYKDATIFLDRKYEKYIAILQRNSQYYQ